MARTGSSRPVAAICWVIDNVEILGVFPADTHSPVLYPIALVQGAKPEAQGFLNFLASSQAAAIFSRYGFTVPK